MPRKSSDLKARPKTICVAEVTGLRFLRRFDSYYKLKTSMKILAIFQILTGLVLFAFSAVAAERGYLLVGIVMFFGTLPIIGGAGLLRGKRWGLALSLMADLVLVILVLTFYLQVRFRIFD